jgi:hypothetical protein
LGDDAGDVAVLGEQFSIENSVEDALLVIGALHRAGVKKRLQDSMQVQIA